MPWLEVLSSKLTERQGRGSGWFLLIVGVWASLIQTDAGNLGLQSMADLPVVCVQGIMGGACSKQALDMGMHKTS